MPAPGHVRLSLPRPWTLGLTPQLHPLPQQRLQLCLPPLAPQLSRIILGTLGTREGTPGSCYRAWLGAREAGMPRQQAQDLNEFQNLRSPGVGG